MASKKSSLGKRTPEPPQEIALIPLTMLDININLNLDVVLKLIINGGSLSYVEQ